MNDIRDCRLCGAKIQVVPSGQNPPAPASIALDQAAPVYDVGIDGNARPIAAYVDHASVCKGTLK